MARNFKDVTPRKFNMPIFFWLTPRLTFGECAGGDTLRDAEGRYLPAIIARARQTLAEHLAVISKTGVPA